MIRVPWMKGKGVATDAFVEFVDIYPSLCELAGLPVPDHLEGFSFVPLIDKPAREWKAAAFSQYMRWHNPEQPWKTAVFSQYMRRHEGKSFMGYSMRTKRYRYVEWKNTDNGKLVARELFDHETDPQENINIADLTENSDLVEQLSKQLNKGWKTALPKDKR